MCRPGKAFNFLKEHGYNIMAVPREDVRLLQLFLLEKKKLYPLDSHLEGADLPRGETDKTVADFNGQAFARIYHIARPVGVTGNRVFHGGDQHQQPHRKLVLHHQPGQRQHMSATDSKTAISHGYNDIEFGIGKL